jgi:hypothetical protein
VVAVVDAELVKEENLVGVEAAGIHEAEASKGMYVLAIPVLAASPAQAAYVTE